MIKKKVIYLSPQLRAVELDPRLCNTSNAGAEAINELEETTDWEDGL